MTDAQRIMAAVGATPVIWVALLVVSALLWACAWISSTRVPSDRLSLDEELIDLAALAPARRERLRAARIPGRRGAWNALVLAQDDNRLKAQIRGNRITRRFVAWSYLAVGLLLVASLLSSVAIYVDAGRTGVLTLSAAVRFVGLLFVFALGWYGIPTMTLWARHNTERGRLPFAWRILDRSHVIKTLSAPIDSRWLGHENPRDGRVSVASAKRLLSTIEAEVIESFAKPRTPGASELLVWRTYEAPRVSRVLEAKARLLGQKRAEVKVEEIYDWIDLVVEELVERKTTRRVLDLTPIAEELLEPRLRAHARRVLWLRFWQSPAGLFSTILALAMGVICVALLYSASRAVFDSYPTELSWINTIVVVAISAIVTHIVAIVFRSSSKSNR